jgi:hypothetical protein
MKRGKSTDFGLTGVAVMVACAGGVLGVGGVVSLASGQGIRVEYDVLLRQGDPLPSFGPAAVADFTSDSLLFTSLEPPLTYADGTMVYAFGVLPNGVPSLLRGASLMRSTPAGQEPLYRLDQPMVIEGLGSFQSREARLFEGNFDPFQGVVNFGQNVVPGNVRSIHGNFVGANRMVPLFASNTQAPGFPEGMSINVGGSSWWPTWISNLSGVALTYGRMSLNGVSTSLVVWQHQLGQPPVLVAQENNQTLVDGATISWMDAPVINGAGEVAILAESVNQVASIWVKRPGEPLTRRFRSGVQLVGGLPGQQITLQLEDRFGPPSVLEGVRKPILQFNRSGRVVVNGLISNGFFPAIPVIYTNLDQRGLQPIVSHGQVLDDATTASWSAFGGDRPESFLNDTGHVVMRVPAVTPSQSNLWALLHDHPATGLRVIARPGMRFEGMSQNETIGSPRAISMDSFGDVWWTASIVPAPSGGSLSAMWRTNVDGVTRLVRRSDQAMQVRLPNGQLQSITPRLLQVRNDSESTWEMRSGLNDAGEFGAMALVGTSRQTWMLRGRMVVCRADMGVSGAAIGQDGVLDNNDLVVFVQSFFEQHPRADLGSEGGEAVADGLFDNNDFVVFIQGFFGGCE